MPPDRARERIERHLEATEPAPAEGLSHGHEENEKAQERE